MQKRQSGGVAAGGSATPAAKRGRPLGSVNSNSAAASAAAATSSAADSVAPPTLLGPSLHVHYAFAGQLVPYCMCIILNCYVDNLSVYIMKFMCFYKCNLNFFFEFLYCN